MALGQLAHMRKKLMNGKQQLELYNNIIIDQLKQGFIEIVEDAVVNDRCHYLPHHGVKKDSETTPIRVVFNCSSKREGCPSLNDCLMSGPSLTAKLGDVLLKFRTNELAYCADISKSFIRVGLQPCDRDVTRFLWYANPFDLKSPIIHYRFSVVLFGATCSPFLLQATLDTHLRT